MCGIAGIVGHSRRAATKDILRGMRDAQLHRGPQDVGLNVFEMGELALGLAHTRLSILDLSSAGHQPMRDSTSENWITYNGEIYNFRQLRDELEAGNGEQRARFGEHRPYEEPGPQWRSQTDTEVILKAYSRWGRDCLHRLRGMFAFALLDKSRKKLLLARDPFGIKPLYYYQSEDVFLFASEIRALLASGLVPRKLNPAGLASYFEFGSVQDPLTIIDGVRSLRPGHSLVVNLHNDRLQFTEQHFAGDVVPWPHARVSTRGEAVEVLRAKLEESIKCHLVSDVPVAAFLSGGVDSSAVVGLMSRVTKEPPRTFTVVFSEKHFSEQKYAHLAARHFKTQHQDILFSERELHEILPVALGALDQPTMDGINTFVIAKAVKEAGVTVALSGLGGDELFAGYPSFRRARQMQKMALLPQGLRSFASALGRSVASHTVRHKKFWDMVESDLSANAACAISRELFAAAEIEALIPGCGCSATSFMTENHAGQRSEFRDQQSAYARLAPGFFSDGDPTNAVSLLELQGYLANTLLRDTDQMSMAHALEIRVPFIDSAVASYVLGLPGEWKVDGKRPKPLLLDALDGMLPEGVWHRPKMGFAVPFQRWMKSTLQPELDDTLSDESRLGSLGLNPRYVSSVWQSFQKHPQHQPWSRPWALYVLAKWCEINNIQS